MREMIFTI